MHEECKQRCDVKQVHLREALREDLAVGGQEEARLGKHARELDQLALGEVLLPPDVGCVLGNACGRTSAAIVRRTTENTAIHDQNTTNPRRYQIALEYATNTKSHLNMLQ